MALDEDPDHAAALDRLVHDPERVAVRLAAADGERCPGRDPPEPGEPNISDLAI